MHREQFYISTIDPNAAGIALSAGMGIEIAEFCTAWNMDDGFCDTDAKVRSAITGISKRILHAPFNELFPCAIDPKARALAGTRYMQAIALSQRYRAEKVVIHGGYNPWIYYPCWYTEQSVEFWNVFLKQVPDGITICLENVLEEEPDMLLDILKAVDDPRLKMCLDIGHVHAYSKIPVESWVEKAAPYISHFHIHNNDGDRDSHQSLTDGSIPMKEILDLANALCSDATYTLELTNSEASVQWLMKHIFTEVSQWKEN